MLNHMQTTSGLEAVLLLQLLHLWGGEGRREETER